jgi:hypothetical protein
MAIEDAAQAVFTERTHPRLDCLLLEDKRRGPLGDERPELVIDRHQFKEALAAFVTGAVAVCATLAVIELLVGDLERVDIEHVDDVLIRLIGGAAGLANATEETLGEHAFKGG